LDTKDVREEENGFLLGAFFRRGANVAFHPSNDFDFTYISKRTTTSTIVVRMNE